MISILQCCRISRWQLGWMYFAAIVVSNLVRHIIGLVNKNDYGQAIMIISSMVCAYECFELQLCHGGKGCKQIETCFLDAKVLPDWCCFARACFASR